MGIFVEFGGLGFHDYQQLVASREEMAWSHHKGFTGHQFRFRASSSHALSSTFVLLMLKNILASMGWTNKGISEVEYWRFFIIKNMLYYFNWRMFVF